VRFAKACVTMCAYIVVVLLVYLVTPSTVLAALSTAAERTLQDMINQAGKLVLLPFTGTSAPSLSTAGTGKIYFDTTSGTFQMSQNGGAYTGLGSGGGSVALTATAFAALGTPANGTLLYCSDCDPPTLVDQTCLSVGAKTGSLAFRVNGAWKCIS
jgi:hypothetical protein